MYKIKEVDNLLDVLKLWNDEMGFIYPIADNIFKQNVIDYTSKKVYGAYIDDCLKGFIIGKTFETTIIPSYNNCGWISLFYVAKHARKQGIASKLFELVENDFKDKTDIHIGRDINNFFPGVPCDFDNLTDSWLAKRGYDNGKYTHDLINCNCKEYILKNNEYQYKVCSKDEIDSLLQFTKKQFDGRWFFEVSNYFENGGDGNEYVVALDNRKVVAFARINDKQFKQYPYNITWYKRFSNLGGIGPLGVDASYRGRNLGYDIVAFAINTLKNRGIKEMIIDWTGLLTFYQQFGFEVWKSYKYITKKG
jgi:GNAT superfamily N-acetyltransferase